MLERLFSFADCRVALVALTLFTLATVTLDGLNPKNRIKFELGDKYIPVGLTLMPRVADIKEMLLNSYEPQHAEAERRFLKYDFGYLVIYGVTLTLILAYLLPVIWQGGLRLARLLALLPAFAALFDLVENVTLYVCMGRDPDTLSRFLPVSRVATMLKLTLIYAALLLLLFGVVKLAWLVLAGKGKG
jgi:cytochrome bd-type quinol oxidase subunit 1